MKIFFLSVFFVAITTINIQAQCDKKVIIVSSQTNHLNSNKDVQRSVDETTTIEYDQKEIVVSPGNDPVMHGTIKSVSCEWKTPFKNGKTVLKAALEGQQGETMNLTITIEGKEGKIDFLAEMDENADEKISIVVDKFEEKK